MNVKVVILNVLVVHRLVIVFLVDKVTLWLHRRWIISQRTVVHKHVLLDSMRLLILLVYHVAQNVLHVRLRNVYLAQQESILCKENAWPYVLIIISLSMDSVRFVALYVKHVLMVSLSVQAVMMDLFIMRQHWAASQTVPYPTNFMTHSHILVQTVQYNVKHVMVPDMTNASLATIHYH